ncbi:MAG: ferritin family protein [Candidatus Thermoplasmatota archaeon]
MFAKEPIDLDKIGDELSEREILRFALAAELDAINFYEQMAEYTDDEDLKKVLLDVAAEEKEHVGEFQTLLLEKDGQQVEEMEEGEEEVRELLGI